MSADDRKTTAREILSAVVLFAAGFLVMAVLTHSFILAEVHDPIYLHADARSEKLAELRGWHAKAFSSAFGTSHVINGFDPRVVDRALAGTPLATHTVNLAIEGGAQSEQLVMADQFVEQLVSPVQAGAAPEPCFITLELAAGTNFTNDHLVHPRAINIYDLATTRIIAQMSTPAMPLTRRLGRAGFAAAAMGEHYLSLGMLSNFIFSPPLSQTVLAEETADDRRGLLPAGDSSASARRIMGQIIKAWPAKPAVSQETLLPGNTTLIQAIKAHSRVQHLTFVYLVMPSLKDPVQTVEYPDHLTVDGQDVPILNMALPAAYPDLYKLDLWRDDAHLNVAGAAVLSKHYAEALEHWYTAHGAPQMCG